MEIRIGVQNIAREIVLESNTSADDIIATVRTTLTDGTPLELTDDKGRTLIVPGDKLGYVEVGADRERRVGFGTS
ncbi:MAG: DUF3107 domain-containing protein [Actinomycetota bacterium]